MASFFTETNRVAAVFGDFARGIRQEFDMTVPLNPQVSFGDILDLEKDGYTAATALWLDRDCVIMEEWDGDLDRHTRYRIIVELLSGRIRHFFLTQVPGTTERGAPIPALEYFLTRLASYGLRSFGLYANDEFSTLDISPDCFSHLLQTSRLHTRTYDNERLCSLVLQRVSLTAEQTDLLFTHDTGPIFIKLDACLFHGPTLLRQLETAALRREHNHALGQGSHLEIALGRDTEENASISYDELTALLSNQHLRSFQPCAMTAMISDYDMHDFVPYEIVRKFVSALAANKISRLESLHFDEYDVEFEWEKEEEPSAWIDLWKAIEEHPSLKEIRLAPQPGLCRQTWWQPIAAAVKINARLVRVDVDGHAPAWKTKFDEHVEPLLQRNRYRPKIAALCCSDPSKTAALLVQAIVAIRNKNASAEIRQMLVHQLVPFDIGGVGQVLGKKRSLADTVVVVPSDVDATKTELRVADGIAASTNNKDNKSNL